MRAPVDNTSRHQGWMWENGIFVSCGSVPLTDRGFRYGMSVFESLPVWEGVPLFLPEHLSRLHESCTRCGFACDKAALMQCEGTLRRAGDGFARIYVTAGDGTVTGEFSECRVFVFVEQREPVPARVYHRGYDLGIEPAPHQPLFGGLKTANYWANLDAFRRGVARQKNETLLFNDRGEMISACMANVFIVRDGKIRTPPQSSGARGGVVREWVMQRRETEECALTHGDLEAADEIFLTSSWLGIMPAASLDEQRVASNLVSSALRKEYADTVCSRSS